MKKVTFHKVLSKSKQQYDKTYYAMTNYFANNKFLVNPGSFQSLKDEGGGGGETLHKPTAPLKGLEWPTIHYELIIREIVH